MNSHNNQGPPAGAVVVGIALDGSEAALTFAADEACRTHSPLHLVHVLRISGAEAYAGVLQGAFEAADATVAQGVARARELVDGQVPVTAERVDGGWLLVDLVDRASRGSMLVLQHRRQSPLHRLVTGSIVAGVASRCAVPVVSVPEGWRPEASEAAEAVVTVGVQDPDEAEPLIRRGLVEARALGARVEVMSAWHIDGGYNSVVSRPPVPRREGEPDHPRPWLPRLRPHAPRYLASLCGCGSSTPFSSRPSWSVVRPLSSS